MRELLEKIEQKSELTEGRLSKLGRERPIPVKKFRGLKKYIQAAREIERMRLQFSKEPEFDNDSPMTWKTDEWIKYIINLVRVRDMKMSDDDMAQNLEKVWQIYINDNINRRYYDHARRLRLVRG